MAFVRTVDAEGRVEFRDLSPPPVPKWIQDSGTELINANRAKLLVNPDGTINGQKLQYLPNGETFEYKGKTYSNTSQVGSTDLNQGRTVTSAKPSGTATLNRGSDGTAMTQTIVSRSGNGTMGFKTNNSLSPPNVTTKIEPPPTSSAPPTVSKSSVGTGKGSGLTQAPPPSSGRTGRLPGGGVGFGLTGDVAGGGAGLGIALANTLVGDYISSKPSQFGGGGADRNSVLEDFGNGIVSGAGQLSSALRDAIFGSSKPPSLDNSNFGKPIPGNQFPPDGSITLTYPYDTYEFSYTGEYDARLINGQIEHRTVNQTTGQFSGQPVSIEVRKQGSGEVAKIYTQDLSNNLQVTTLTIGQSSDNSSFNGKFTSFNFKDVGGGEIFKVVPPPSESSNFQGDVGSAGSSEASWSAAGGTGESPGGMGSSLGSSMFSGSAASGAGVGPNSAPSQFSGPRSSVAGAGASSRPGDGTSRGPGPGFSSSSSAGSGVGAGASAGTGTGTSSKTFFGNGTTSNGIDSENKTTKQLNEETKTKPESKPESKPETKTPPNCEDPCIQGLHDKLDKQGDVIKIKVPIFKECLLDNEGIQTGEGKSQELEIAVSKQQAPLIAAQFERLFRIESLQCREPIAIVPDWWKLRRGSSVPQLAVLFAEQHQSGKLGKSRWTMHIPHYDRPKGFKPGIPAYTKGNWQGILTLADGSKIGVNASSSSECKRVLNKLKILIPVQFRTKDGKAIQPRIIESPDSNLKQVRVVPVRADFYHQGSLNPEPKWSINLRK